MIPSTTNQLLVSEDWKKIYQSFRNADFKSYDFETLRRTMIQYLQENYPEDFNDFIDSSEYIALIDVIAYLGQNLSFRIDLNARENFLETAQRRDSILRLAQLISYNPSRNVPAHGFLKVTAISTTDNVLDSNGTNLANTTIGWNDPANPNWYQQFINIINSAMTSNFGNPSAKKTIDGIGSEEYKINSTNQDVPIFNFIKAINGTPMPFEIVSSTFLGKDYIYEQAPRPAQAFGLIYKNDNQGSGSANTGFFAHFRQGALSLSNFSIDAPIPNEIIGVNTPSINNSDVWLWQLDKNGNYSTLWTPVPSLLGNNVIYNSLNKDLRTIYAVTSRNEDQIDLNFADGVFGDLPKGEFRLFYRQSNGLSYIIKPDQMSGILISVEYSNAVGQIHSLQLTLSLQYTVGNSSGPETNINIQTKAPQTYYTQNRMITGEDYNIAPLNAGSDILKIKSVNRISSGLSRYFDISDVTGKYSRTNIFANDGILYKESVENNFEFEFVGKGQVLSVIKNSIASIVNSLETRSFYFDNYPRLDLSSLGLSWKEVNKTPGQSRGYFYNANGSYAVGLLYSSTNLRYIGTSALVKFTAPTGKYFDSKNNLKTIPTSGIPLNGSTLIWSTVNQVILDGAATLDDGTGPIILGSRVPGGAIPSAVIPKYVDVLGYPIENEMANLCLTQKNFGLTIDTETRVWSIILNSNLNTVDSFDLTNQNNIEDQGLDSSWLLCFIWTGKYYQIRYRGSNYIFESEEETAFYVDKNNVNYDYTTNTVIKDKIDILSINTKNNGTTSIGYDHNWQVDNSIVESDGYINPNRVKVSVYDYNSTGKISNPDSFADIVGNEFVYFKRDSSRTTYSLTRDDIITVATEKDVINEDKTDNQLFYFSNSNLDVVKYWSTSTASFVYTDEYFVRKGRPDLKFHYVHNSGEERRIDPSKSNIIDIFVLTTGYDTEFRSWLLGNISSEPLPPTSQGLEQNYSETLNPIKAISDEIIYHPVKYKILFGSKANTSLQAKFKAVKNSSRNTTDNDLKTRILATINNFFALENWEFGQTFNFSELSTYIMNIMTPDITNFVIVPTADIAFGSLYEVTCLPNEILISGAAISDIEIIDAITASQLKSSSAIVTNTGS
jgi:hypothetical protein